jgi:glycosyltransferase involved in cell wall biosynthesis
LRPLAMSLRALLNFELLFCGGDLGLSANQRYRKSLQSEASASPYRGRIHFHDLVDNPYQVLRNAFAALNFSTSESFSLTCVEAGLAGIPIIATRCGGPQEIVEDGRTGLLVPVKDIYSMSNAIYQLARDPHHVSFLQSLRQVFRYNFAKTGSG